MKQKKLNTKTPMVSLTADEGFYLAKINTPLKDVPDTRETSVPLEQVADYAEYPKEAVEAAKAEAERVRKYEARVVALIRERYDQSAEDAVKRKLIAFMNWPHEYTQEQAEAIKDEFHAFNAYAEQCKAKAKEEIEN